MACHGLSHLSTATSSLRDWCPAGWQWNGPAGRLAHQRSAKGAARTGLPGDTAWCPHLGEQKLNQPQAIADDISQYWELIKTEEKLVINQIVQVSKIIPDQSLCHAVPSLTGQWGIAVLDFSQNPAPSLGPQAASKKLGLLTGTCCEKSQGLVLRKRCSVHIYKNMTVKRPKRTPRKLTNRLEPNPVTNQWRLRHRRPEISGLETGPASLSCLVTAPSGEHQFGSSSMYTSSRLICFDLFWWFVLICVYVTLAILVALSHCHSIMLHRFYLWKPCLQARVKLERHGSFVIPCSWMFRRKIT